MSGVSNVRRKTSYDKSLGRIIGLLDLVGAVYDVEPAWPGDGTGFERSDRLLFVSIWSGREVDIERFRKAAARALRHWLGGRVVSYIESPPPRRSTVDGLAMFRDGRPNPTVGLGRGVVAFRLPAAVKGVRA